MGMYLDAKSCMFIFERYFTQNQIQLGVGWWRWVGEFCSNGAIMEVEEEVTILSCQTQGFSLFTTFLNFLTLAKLHSPFFQTVDTPK